MNKELLVKVVALLDPSDAEYMIASDIINLILDEVERDIRNIEPHGNWQIRTTIELNDEVIKAIDKLRGSDE